MILCRSSAVIQRRYVFYLRKPYWRISDRRDVNRIFLSRINRHMAALIKEERAFNREDRAALAYEDLNGNVHTVRK